MIKILGLGPGSKDSLTVGAVETLKSGIKTYFRTEIHPTVEYIKKIGIEFETYDHKYEENQSFDDVYSSIAEDIIKKHEEFKDLIYAVPGHPLVAEKSVLNLLELCEEKGIETEIMTAVSFIDVMMEVLKVDPIEGLTIVDAFEINNSLIDRRVNTIITQVYNKMIASEVKINLSQYYDDEKEIIFVRAAGIKGEESIRRMPLYQIDWQEDIDYLTSIFIPKDSQNKYYDFYDLVKIIEHLRGEDGCPWDREQTHESLKNSLIEESYEVIDAIDKKDDNGLIEELGDVLLQVVMHSVIGKEEGFFNERDVIKSICEKMIYRHPHVFGNDRVENSNEVLYNWEELKKTEKGYETHTDVLNGVARSFPALIRAEKVQKKAAKVGFDWDNVEPAMAKVLEELQEIKDVYKSGNESKILEEVGDLFFAVVNVARFLGIDCEAALNYTIDKFIRRFEYIEKSAISNGKELEKMTLEEMDKLWEEAKGL